jgi:ribulose-phosphate 3-epimerase
MKQPRIVPAVIASNQGELDECLGKVKGFASTVQLDVMDGEFVPSRSLDFEPRLSSGPHYQAHLMVVDVWSHIERFRSEAGTVIVHAESLGDLRGEVKRLKRLHNRLFLALNPETPVSVLKPVIGDLDGVMVMTVNPGMYGGRFLPECLDKAAELKELRGSLTVEVDGGMVPGTVRLARMKGVDLFASGSYIMKSADPLRAYRELEAAAEAQ